MAILFVILLVLWAIVIVVGFSFEGLMWLGIIGIILFVGTVVVGLIRMATLRRRAQAQRSPEPGALSHENTRAEPTSPLNAGHAGESAGTSGRSPSAAPNAAPTASAQRDGQVSDDTVNPAGNLE